MKILLFVTKYDSDGYQYFVNPSIQKEEKDCIYRIIDTSKPLQQGEKSIEIKEFEQFQLIVFQKCDQLNGFRPVQNWIMAVLPKNCSINIQLLKNKLYQLNPDDLIKSGLSIELPIEVNVEKIQLVNKGQLGYAPSDLKQVKNILHTILIFIICSMFFISYVYIKNYREVLVVCNQQ